MRIDVLTLFPEMFEGVFQASILGKARDKGIVKLNAVNFRLYANNKHNTVDDYPYGGGGGMVLKPEPIFAAVEDLAASVREEQAPFSPEGLHNDGLPEESQVHAQGGGEGKPPRVILMCPQGETFTQKKAEELAKEERLIFVCGHYEGYDERIRQYLVTDELSIGDYVLTGGELPAMVVIDSVVRLLPGVLGNENSAVTDSFSTGLLEYPHYTRPASFRGWDVPDVLISGHHENIDKWRRRQSLERTWRRRPELLEGVELSRQDKQWLDQLKLEMERPKEASNDQGCGQETGGTKA
ncbi:tRNA (guanosine(37)-N1)-methyltransferase TrmD [Paenibacillus contaminans]|uniref:tRNA (guanine-N(1)-)-methyltransferase n=1 Tax=Paenibacillus contaminans TaxID=450362 RepID=A0A329MK21_9BACL|nr:tRNA (guanosine(37)-N1)-methyltransferase TrmD [Paenibacillus contaminans]RAV20002.1 tRNA (guanosine(37)-N1)-methyltransferase TrmD [Paenibacillus contaminans]